MAAYIPAINTAQLEATVKKDDSIIMFTAVANLGETLKDKTTPRSAVLLSFKRKNLLQEKEDRESGREDRSSDYEKTHYQVQNPQDEAAGG